MTHTSSKWLPFTGVHYNTQKITNLADVVTPPYDVISPEMQEGFYQKSPYNFVRIDFSREAGDAKYDIAGKDFQSWLAQEILVQDATPAFYLHHQIFTLTDGRTVTRKGFFGVRRLEDFSEGGIKPHEKTLEGPKADRLKLMRATQTQLSPVFTLYADGGKKIDALVERTKQAKPLMDFKTHEGERHVIWREEDPNICQQMAQYLEDQPIFIADGHHRYETALNFRNEKRKQTGKVGGPSDSVLMYASNLRDEGLIILPIHRALHSIAGFQMGDLLQKLSQYFQVTPLATNDRAVLVQTLAEAQKQGAHAFAVLGKNPQESYLISLTHDQWRKMDLAKKVSSSLQGLDVTVLHTLVFEHILGITPEAQARQDNLIYWKDTQKAINETQKGNCDATFLLNPTRIEQMEEVALAGEKMPQKSTYFFPKILSGLILYKV